MLLLRLRCRVLTACLAQISLLALDRDPTASVKSIASSVGSRRSLEGKHKEPTLRGLRLSVTPGQLVGICGQVQSILSSECMHVVRVAFLLALFLFYTRANPPYVGGQVA